MVAKMQLRGKVKTDPQLIFITSQMLPIIHDKQTYAYFLLRTRNNT